MTTNSLFAMILLLSMCSPLCAAPLVTGNTMTWPDDDWYQEQSASTNESLCQGGVSCSVAQGAYNVIDHSTGDRFEGIEVFSEVVEPVPISSQVNVSEPVLGMKPIYIRMGKTGNDIISAFCLL